MKLINIKGNFAVYKDLHVNIEFVTKKYFFTRMKNKNAVKPYSSRAYCLFYACSGNDFVWDGDRATCTCTVRDRLQTLINRAHEQDSNFHNRWKQNGDAFTSAAIQGQGCVSWIQRWHPFSFPRASHSITMYQELSAS